jgi:hypothetical protein
MSNDQSKKKWPGGIVILVILDILGRPFDILRNKHLVKLSIIYPASRVNKGVYLKEVLLAGSVSSIYFVTS